jgi:hypothetical protein
MVELEIFLASDQPTTCPKCGTRTEIINDLETSQLHECASKECSFRFILEFEEEEEL